MNVYQVQVLAFLKLFSFSISAVHLITAGEYGRNVEFCVVEKFLNEVHKVDSVILKFKDELHVLKRFRPT